MAKATPEDAIERQIRGLCDTLGVVVMTLSQGARGHYDQAAGKFIADRGGVRQTPGLSDLELWIPRADGTFQLAKFETKTPDGLKLFERLRRLLPDQVKSERAMKDYRRVKAQERYAALCLLAGVPYGRGGMPEFLTLLRGCGLLKEGEQRGDAPLLVRSNGNALKQLADVAGRA